ncbi:Protein of unknown function [Bacillus cereus]|nr:Protein of unknown function [Bacillus cereus]
MDVVSERMKKNSKDKQ